MADTRDRNRPTYCQGRNFRSGRERMASRVLPISRSSCISALHLRYAKLAISASCLRSPPSMAAIPRIGHHRASSSHGAGHGLGHHRVSSFLASNHHRAGAVPRSAVVTRRCSLPGDGHQCLPAGHLKVSVLADELASEIPDVEARRQGSRRPRRCYLARFIFGRGLRWVYQEWNDRGPWATWRVKPGR
jgi:hypothetical protein